MKYGAVRKFGLALSGVKGLSVVFFTGVVVANARYIHDYSHRESGRY